MDKQTRDALEASIRHWRKNFKRAKAATVTTENLSYRHCALCNTFGYTDCQGCPVQERTGITSCYGSPYYTAYASVVDFCLRQTHQNNPDNSDCVKACKAELDFLISLRPVDEG